MDAVIKAKVMDMRLDVQSEPDPEPVILPFPRQIPIPTVSREHLEAAKADVLMPSIEPHPTGYPMPTGGVGLQRQCGIYSDEERS